MSTLQMYGAAKQYATLQTLMQLPEFAHIVAGPPGSMKTTMITAAATQAGLRVEMLDIDHQSTPKLEETIRKLGTSVLSNSNEPAKEPVWLVLGAEMLPASAAAVWKAGAAMGHLRLVLEMWKRGYHARLKAE